MSDVKLLACPNPWCTVTSDPRLSGFRYYGKDTFEVACRCGISGPVCGSEAEAIAAWNERPAPALTPKQEAADTPEQMRERCFHDFLLLLEGCAAGVGNESARVLRSFAHTLKAQGTAGLGTGNCICEADDCPYKTAPVPCDCGLPDCTDPRAALAKAGRP